MSGAGNHCSFVLLAEFNIHEGASLRYQFPQPLGVNEAVLAMSMLPDGAETQLDDWTVFFLNQTPWNTIQPAIESPEEAGEEKDLLCVLNLVRTKHDKSLQRGAQVLALAICTRHPFIQIFKPVLLMALDDYFASPSQDCLARLFDAINSMDLSGAPVLTRHEKLVMRACDRKDVFLEKFQPQTETRATNQFLKPAGIPSASTGHRSNMSVSSYSSFDENIMMRTQPDGNLHSGDPRDNNRDWDATVRAGGARDTDSYSSQPTSTSTSRPPVTPPSDSSFTLGGSAVWVGDDSSATMTNTSSEVSGDDSSSVHSVSYPTSSGYRHRSSTDASSLSLGVMNMARDTHFYQTSVKYKDHVLPIKMPLSSFKEEVGDYSLIPLLKTFTNPTQGPTHPHLHTNGVATHPIIVLFNALITGKRIIFMGHKRPAGEVSNFVLGACALGSGCGAVLRGFIERTFPYANLENRDEWESVPAYIAGVTNPIFSAFKTWDLLLDIKTGIVTVASDIHQTYSYVPLPTFARVGSFNKETPTSLDEKDKLLKEKSTDSVDSMFIEDLRAAIEYHYGESLVRLRFSEYVSRFVRIAARYEEDVYGSTKIGPPSYLFTPVGPEGPKLGSGLTFLDESNGAKELAANTARIEAWRKTNSYELCMQDYAEYSASNPIQGFDPLHQIFRLKQAKMSDSEASLIMKTFAANVKTYEQVVELFMYLIPQGGLMALGFGLFHPKESVREATIELFDTLRLFPVGVLFLQTLNHFQRYAYVRQAHDKETQLRNRTLKRTSELSDPQPTQVHVPPMPAASSPPPSSSSAMMTGAPVRPPMISRTRSASSAAMAGFGAPMEKTRSAEGAVAF